MQSADQYVERTPDLVARVRALREAAQKEMDSFTRVADYDVRRVVGRGPKPAAAPSTETVACVQVGKRLKKRSTSAATDQPMIDFAPVPAERADDEEGA